MHEGYKPPERLRLDGAIYVLEDEKPQYRHRGVEVIRMDVYRQVVRELADLRKRATGDDPNRVYKSTSQGRRYG